MPLLKSERDLAHRKTGAQGRRQEYLQSRNHMGGSRYQAWTVPLIAPKDSECWGKNYLESGLCPSRGRGHLELTKGKVAPCLWGS